MRTVTSIQWLDAAHSAAEVMLSDGQSYTVKTGARGWVRDMADKYLAAGGSVMPHDEANDVAERTIDSELRSSPVFVGLLKVIANAHNVPLAQLVRSIKAEMRG